jgi:glycosyltransferase involved in cell wall biosynthesis
MMRVLLITSQFPPSNATGARRPYYLARALADRGHQVTVLTDDRPSDPAPWTVDTTGIRVERQPSTERPPDLGFGGRITLGLLRLLGGRPPQWWRRALDPFLPLFHGRRWSLSLAEMDRRVGPQDVIVASGPHWYPLYLAWQLAGRTGTPYLPDYRDPWNIVIPEVALNCIHYHGTPPFSWVRRSRSMAAERAILRDAAALTAATPSTLANALQVTGHAHGTVVFNGWVPGPPLPPPPAEGFTVLYTGRLYAEQDWDMVVRAMALAAEEVPGLRLCVRGRADTAGLPQALAFPQSGPCPVELLPEVPRDALLAEFAQAHALLTVACEGNPGVVPLKLMDYLAYDRPVLVAGRTEGIQQDIVRRTGKGLCGSDAERLAAAIVELYRAREGARVRSADEEAALAELSIDRQMQRWIDLLAAHAKRT